MIKPKDPVLITFSHCDAVEPDLLSESFPGIKPVDQSVNASPGLRKYD